MKKTLYIDSFCIADDRAGHECSLSRLSFAPKVFQNLSRIQKDFDYALVLCIPENAEALLINEIVRFCGSEAILFEEILQPAQLEERLKYKQEEARILISSTSYPGNRLFGNNVIHLIRGEKPEGSEKDWTSVYSALSADQRKATVIRKTSETDIQCFLNLDGNGQSEINTGLAFFDHMLQQIARHGNVDLNIKVQGDLHIDEHHTIEDVGLALGSAFHEALGNKKGIERYGFLLPMDDCLAQVALDFGGRPWLVWDVDFRREKVGDMPTEMFHHFFKSFSDTAKCNLNIKAEGSNEHHKIESIFKSFAKSIAMAISKNSNNSIPSTKGSL